MGQTKNSLAFQELGMIIRSALVQFFGLLLLFVGITTDTAALSQPTAVASVTAGGATHLVVYPLNDASNATRIEAALPTIITNYETLWNSSSNTPMAFRLLIDAGLDMPSGDDLSDAAFESIALPVPSAPNEWTGATENAPTNACHVKLFNAPVLNPANRLEYELALAAARCYLLNSVTAAPRDFWLKGLANWMAIQVYNPPADVLASLQKDYQDSYNQNVFNGSDEAMYFWEFLLGGQIPNSPYSDVAAVTTGLNNMSQMNVDLTADLFYTYANLVAQGGLPWQPSAGDLADDKNISLDPLPADVDLDLEENSIYIASVTLPEPEEGKGVTITAENLADSGTIAAVGSGGSFTPIADGDSLDVCGESQLTIVAGRAAPSNPGSQALSGPSLTVSLKDPCESKMPPCLVGTWQLDVPSTMGSSMVTLEGGLREAFRADGTTTEQYDNLVATIRLPNTAPNVVTYVAASYTGMTTVQRDPQTPGRYNVTSWQHEFVPGGEITSQTLGGPPVDITGELPLKFFGDSEPSVYQCDTDNAQNTHFTNYIAGPTAEQMGATVWTFTRVP
jgi:hypothetical protein